jgi:hypothetical protein
MKTKCLLIFLTVFFTTTHTSNAQFWKKLQKKVEKRVEEVIINKTEDKASEQSGKIMEEILNPDFQKNSPIAIGEEKGNIDDIPESYEFTWSYELTIVPEKAKESLKLTYHLKEDADYFGTKMELSMPMLIVFDVGLNSTIMFMNQDGNKRVMVNKIPNAYTNIDTESSSNVEDYTMTKIGGKEILGYSCQGYVFENSVHKFTTYITFEVPVSFTNVFGNSEKMPQGFKDEWLIQDGKNGLMMEMQMEDKNKAKNTMKMYCTGLEEESLVINISEYKSF